MRSTTRPCVWAVLLCLHAAGVIGRSCLFDNAENNSSSSWTYTGERGSLYWPNTYPRCNGSQQSPIDINSTTAVPSAQHAKLHFYQWDEKTPEQPRMRNSGRAVEVDLNGDYFLSGGALSGRYRAVQMVFHWGRCNNTTGSEHHLDGRAFPLEMQVWLHSERILSFHDAVERGAGLAALSVLFQVRKEVNPDLNILLHGMPHISNQECSSRPGNVRVEMSTLGSSEIMILQISWKRPLEVTSVLIHGYTILYYDGKVQREHTVQGDQSTGARLEGLNLNKPYTIQVRAVCEGGWFGPLSIPIVHWPNVTTNTTTVAKLTHLNVENTTSLPLELTQAMTPTIENSQNFTSPAPAVETAATESMIETLPTSMLKENTSDHVFDQYLSPSITAATHSMDSFNSPTWAPNQTLVPLLTWYPSSRQPDGPDLNITGRDPPINTTEFASDYSTIAFEESSIADTNTEAVFNVSATSEQPLFPPAMISLVPTGHTALLNDTSSLESQNDTFTKGDVELSTIIPTEGFSTAVYLT
uniref:carbonic anhydrase n=1 Tax=Eptatretus burgeri TaxID=7764 RepID=A0A8C4X038_EPTBU